MAAGDITTIPIKDGAGTTRQVPFEEQADGSLAPVHYARGPEGGSIPVQVSGSKVAEALDETDLVTGDLTLAAAPEFVRIYNTDGTNDGVFTVNGIALAVPAGTALETGVAGTASTTVTVTGSTSFIFHRLA